MATKNAINSSKPVEVASGGTGVSSLTAYAVTCGGTTAAGAVQSVASVGTADQLLTSNGAGALPTFQSYLDPGSLNLIETQEALSDAWNEFTTGIDGTYSKYCFVMSNCKSNNSSGQYLLQLSTDGGSSYIYNDSNYDSTNLWNDFNSTTRTSNYTNGGAQWTINDNSSSPNYPFNAVIWLYNMGTNTKAFGVGESTQRSSAGTLRYGAILLGRRTTETINAFKITGSGYFASGTLSLYGVVD